MKAKPPRKTERPDIAFWDTSAVVPLCFFQPQSAQAHLMLRQFGNQVTWWATVVEAVSALNRLAREGLLAKEDKQKALNRLGRLRKSWNEIQPSVDLRDSAERLLGVHKLRAADALQLSAALMWCRQRPRDRSFIVGDEDLANAAEIEGFTVVRL